MIESSGDVDRLLEFYSDEEFVEHLLKIRCLVDTLPYTVFKLFIINYLMKPHFT
jgi:hypothetical protein